MPQRTATLRSRLPRIDVTAAELLDARVHGRAPDVFAVPVSAEGEPAVDGLGEALQARLGVVLAEEIARGKQTGTAGEVTTVPVRTDGVPADTLLLVGVGDGTAQSLRRGGAGLGRATKGRARLAVAVPDHAGEEELRAFGEGVLLGGYGFPGYSSSPGKGPVAEVTVSVPGGQRRKASADRALERAALTALAVERARDLANTPSNDKDPAWLVARAAELAQPAGVAVRVFDERELATGGFGGIVAVGAGSVRPPRLLELRYEPSNARERRHVVLVGKGITFDSGGLSLKPREAMVAMKTDMAGGAVVIAVLAALADLGVRVRVTGLVPAAENLPGAAAMRPGDVISQYGGRTVEVLNTDAEGRLVLADALSYADAALAPDVVVDVATLTGAASLGLGRRHAALYSTDSALQQALTRASDASGERVWPMPLVEDYRPALDSPVADLANVTRDRHISGGSILAALFLREFVGRRPWAHLDIAGPARADADEHEVSRGATGYGVRLLLRWLEEMPGPRWRRPRSR